MKGSLLVCALFAVLLSVEAAAAGQCSPERRRIDGGWRFLRGDPSDAYSAAFDDGGWRVLDVPHDWSIESAYSRENAPQNAWLPGGVGWYRRTIDVPETWLNRRVLVRFEGVYMNSRVWLNGREVGGRPYGFMTFSCDLSGHLKSGRNVLALRVDDTPEPTSRYYHGGGIYGHVDLLVLPPVHLVPDGGVFVRTTALDGGRAELAVDTEVRNDSAAAADVRIRHRVLDDAGLCVAEAGTDAQRISPAGEGKTACHIEFDGAQPWSPDEPYLYRLESTVESDGRAVDMHHTPFGVRTVAFRPDTGFWLNGGNIKLKGVCEHEELGPMGLAVPGDLIAWRLGMLKAMGCNAVRTAHNPFTPTFYDLCDRLGIMVMDEVFDGWHRKGANDYGGRFFAEWRRRDVTDWVRRDRNHPSVIMYSIGNETGRTDEHDITGLIHALDPTRSTTGGNVLYGVDVSGFNGLSGMPGVLESFHAKHPDRPVVLTEAPHTIQTRGFYRVRTWWRDRGNTKIHRFPGYGDEQIFFDGHPRYRSSYDNCGVRINARTCWKRTRDMPWISGEFRWTGFDCLGEAQFMGAEFPKRNYNSGVIDLAGLPKDLYYFYQSQWTDAPMLHLLPHWTHPGLAPGTIIPVVAYSNCDEVELRLNGKSLGRKGPGDLLDFVWHVPWRPGELEAVGYRKGKEAVETRLRTAGPPVRLRLDVERIEGAAALQGASGATRGTPATVLLAVSAVDAAGVVVPWAKNRVDFVLSGGVRLLGYENGDPMDGTGNREPWRNLFYGRLRGFYQARQGGEGSEVTAVAILGESLFEERATVAMDCRRVSLCGEPRAARVAIHYTVDGSEPTAASPMYRAPIRIEATTAVRALVLIDGREAARSTAEFVRGKKPRVSDHRWH